MGNIDEKRLSALLERIGKIKVELEALENEVRALAADGETVIRHDTQAEPIDDIPIDIDIPESDIPPVVEEPAAGYGAASSAVASTGSATTEETIEPTEQSNPATETTPVIEPAIQQDAPAIDVPEGTAESSMVTEPIEATTQPAELSPVTEPVEVTTEPNVPTEPTPLDDLPFDDDLPLDGEPAPAPEPAEEPALEPMLDIESEFEINPAPQPASKPKTSILDSQKAETAVMDVMAEQQAWRTDRPGSQVKNVISAISLNDRVLLINVLFKEDPILFQNTISAFNNMTSLDEAIAYINSNFPDWDLNSEPVYRLMMAVRRKLR